VANHRLIHRKAQRGERSSSLSHLGFRVWVQYQLTADDYGVCPAAAAKFQGDNPALAKETQKRIQGEIENLIRVGLCGVFQDGSQRYLYQADWQDFQKIEWPTETSYPQIPQLELAKCSESTRRLLAKKSAKSRGDSSEPTRARNANANAGADANADANANAPAPMIGVQGRGAFEPGTLPRDHARHALCGTRFRLCLSYQSFASLEAKYGGSKDESRTALEQFVAYVETLVGDGAIGDHLWLLNHFENWLVSIGRVAPAPPSPHRAKPGDNFDGMKEFVRNG
jgi:hypothetical protein